MNQVEAITMEELTALTSSSDRVYMQSLMVRERLLGPDHKDTVFGLMYRGAVYADSHSYQRCVDLWKYAFNLRHCQNERVTHEGLYTLQALCKLFLEIDEEHSGGFTNEAVRYEDVSSIFNTICDEVEAAFLSSKDGILQTTTKEDYNILVMLLLHIIHLLDHIAIGPDDVLAFRRRVHQLLKKKFSLMDGRTLLHLAMDYKTSNIGGDFYSKFPNRQVVKLLVGCGAEVNAVDGRANTPLHVCSKLVQKGNLDQAEMAQSAKIAKVLIASGAHMDARNKRGQLASDGLTQLPLQLRPLNHVTLKCLAARTVRSSEIAYEGEVPKSLHKFIELH
ncbi:hypothetical protein CAPTEDRAFT_206942 [Capitella teleta]|uniref:Uncharacterized protein n=1 Tax=Capitella teleta TaxID=283909 RepID=R7UUA6_CAPTE|nr:hypothetical protein CAPTEDRAFT_206942 [Capitella teleta]|eukprot:ELU09748.1 hypothetical protein CAPTEDRAFT_206942 [Capitella teleta]